MDKKKQREDYRIKFLWSFLYIKKEVGIETQKEKGYGFLLC